jgi:hypothetical protein
MSIAILGLRERPFMLVDTVFRIPVENRLRTSPLSGQAAINSSLRLPMLPACHSGAALGTTTYYINSKENQNGRPTIRHQFMAFHE